MRGQISVEYLIIIAVAIGILVPGVLFFYTYSQSSTGSSTNARLNEIGLRVTSTVQSTYALGLGARETVEFVLPTEVSRVYVNETELVFVYDTAAGPSEAVFFSIVNMTGPSPDGNISEPHAGITRYRITSLGQTVLINETA